MPRIFVDEQEYTISNQSGATTVGELLTDLMTSLADSQKIIGEVNVDGIPLTEDSLQLTTQRQTAGIKTIMLKTIPYEALARFGLQRAVFLAREVIRQAELSVEHFRVAPRREADRIYAACLDDLQLLVDVVDQLLKLPNGRLWDGYHPEYDALRSYLYKLGAVTGELVLAYRKDDVMILTDLLLYELVPLLKDIHQWLETSHGCMRLE
jgi:hypothetical protein